MGTGWIGDLDDLSMPPAIRTSISRGNRDICALSPRLRRVHPQTPIALLDHLWISLAIRCEPHHQLRNAHR